MSIGRLALAVSVFSAAVVAVAAQQPKPAPVTQKPTMMAASISITGAEKATWDNYKSDLSKSAEQMPEKDYSFRPPTMPAADKKEIRTFGEILLHVAEENGLFCSVAGGMTAPADTATAATSKAAVQKALADSFTLCDKVWAATNEKNGSTPVEMPFNLGHSTRLAVLAFNTAHDAEHYGNVVTYLRAKGLVPPSSQPAGK